MALTIKTNNQYRDLRYRNEVPEPVLSSQFDHMAEEDALAGFFEYCGHWYHLSDFMRIDHNEDLKDWSGYASDSAFSGVVIKLSRDGESVKCGTYFS